MAQSGDKLLSAKEKEELLDTLQRRFEKTSAFNLDGGK